MRQTFVEKNFGAASLDVIEKANTILAEYAGQDLVLTLRQLYYQFVARGMLPNKQAEYSRLSRIISDARLAGMVDWAMLEDRTRYVRCLAAWDSPSDIIEGCAQQFRLDLWDEQKWRPEVWIEKDALVGVIEAPCEALRVPFFACRGYSSQSAQYEAGMRFRDYARRGQQPIVFHFGDHDPSGIDMTRDNTDRLSMFAGQRVKVVRLALTYSQIEQYNPPPNPAKDTDPRATDYRAEYGDESWELDALEPSVIATLIRDNVNDLLDKKRWKARQDEEAKAREALQGIADRYDDVCEFLE